MVLTPNNMLANTNHLHIMDNEKTIEYYETPILDINILEEALVFVNDYFGF